jgi:hypothetical protein
MNKYFLIGGGVATLGALLFARKKSGDTVSDVQNAIAGVKEDAAGNLVPVPLGGGPTVALRLTGYWPFTARADEQKMEGGVKDRKGQPLHTLEDFQNGKAPFVSCAGDYTIWPYGQRFALDEFPGVVFRVVDTGGHFFGAGKLYRAVGTEPIDVCVNSSSTKLPKIVQAKIIPGDNFAKGKDIAYGKFKDQTVTAGDLLAMLKRA